MFYIILQGRVSVWLPVPHTQMIGPLVKFKKMVQERVKNTNIRAKRRSALFSEKGCISIEIAKSNQLILILDMIFQR